MAYQRRQLSSSYGKLLNRISSLNEVDPNFDLGDGIDHESLQQFMDALRAKMEQYNNTLLQADTLRDEYEALNRKADDIAERIYAKVIGKYGRDSQVYQSIGGIRKSKIDYSGSRPVTYEGSDPAPMNDSQADPPATNGSPAT